jgi:branched-chain amino acid transport system permease protein
MIAQRRAFAMQTAMMIALLAAAPLVVYPVFVMKALCFALFASAFNLLVGHGGLLSFGHAMFLGTAAYGTAYAAREWGLSPGLAIGFGTVIAAALGAVVGALAIRRQGIYFAMITLGFAQMVYFLCVQAPWTGGENGLQGVPRGTLLWVFDLRNTTTLYFVVIAIFVSGFLAIHRVIHSPFGEVLRAIREHEPRMVSLGYDVDRYKWLAFVLSAALAGLAGSTKCIVFQLASLTDVHWSTSGEVVLMTLLGGLGRVWGPVVGAMIVITLESYLGPLGGWFTVVEGAIFVVCVSTFREGIAGALGRFVRRPAPTA